jgi:chromatin segregation and condensation protein Rec8/ScpA/Scc1 (kleisin family)
VKYVSDPPSPPQLAEDVQGKEEAKKKERCEVGEGDDTVTIEDTSNDEDEDTLQERFQLRSRFSWAGMPNIPVIVKKPASLESSLPVLPRRPRNATRKHTAKNLKMTETMSQEVRTMGSSPSYEYCVLTV